MLTMYMIVEVGFGRHGNFPASLPAAGWTEVLAGERPEWVQGPGLQHEMAVYKKQTSISNFNFFPPVTHSCHFFEYQSTYVHNGLLVHRCE